MTHDSLRLEVAYALPDRQRLIALIVDAHCTVLEAVHRSGILAEFPEIDLEHGKLGIWGKVVTSPETMQLRDGDRIEIYRPLLIDPKVVRQARADTQTIKLKRFR
ncbi:MAG: RnfH family protein [Spongiibacteraceae bacterium]